VKKIFSAAAADMDLVTRDIPVAYWQAFRKSDLADGAVQVRGLPLTKKQLSGYRIYEDNDTAVFDFTRLMMPDDYGVVLDRYRSSGAANQNYSYGWIQKLHEYVRKNGAKMIRKTSRAVPSRQVSERG
jgi:hypothetical protein